MAILLLFACTVLACKTQAQCLPPRLPLTTPVPPQVCNPSPQVCNPPPQVCVPPPQVCVPPPKVCVPPPQVCVPPPQVCTTSPQVVTTIVDNSVSNSLANAIQLLIVSNLIENTMKSQCASPVSVCEPIQTPLCSPTIDCLAPQIAINPYIPYEPTITPIIDPCPCDPIEIIPNVCYPEVFPIANVGCDCAASIVPNYGCGCDTCGSRYVLPNLGCGCDNCSPNLGIQNFGLPNIGCGCDSCGPTFGIQNFGLPNIGCGCDSCGPKFGIQNIAYETLANVLGPRCGCDAPLFPSPLNCNCGFPNLPIGINVESLGIIDSCSCPNKFGIYY